MTALLKWPDKDPDEVLDYTMRWLKRVGEDDPIETSTWIVPDGITKTDEITQATYTVIWLSGGTAGQTYTLQNRIVTAGGRTMDQSVRLRISDK